MPRFVILWHEAGPKLGRPSHFDLLFEQGGDARAFCIESPLKPGCELAADELPRHRLHYFDYEGPILGERGFVTRWDKGEYETLAESLEQFIVRLRGERCNGVLSLTRQNNAWRLQWTPPSSTD